VRGTFYSAATMERLACELLVRQQKATRKPLVPPISAEAIVDAALCDELRSILWEPIPEPPERTILAGLAPGSRLIILNESRQQLIMETAGLYNTLVAHEIAHWQLHVDHAVLDQLLLVDTPETSVFSCERDDPASWDEKNAHRFMGYLLLPRDILLPQVRKLNLMDWSNLYRLREQFDVTITALTTRLQELKLIYIDPHGRIYPSQREAEGQLRLF
jgi:hypothetical protein